VTYQTRNSLYYTGTSSNAADPDPLDTDPDPVFHFYTDPDPAFQFDTDLDTTV
jgi:hypothetical protein